MYNEHTHFFRDQCVFNISCDKDRGNYGGKKEKGVEKLFKFDFVELKVRKFYFLKLMK